MILLGNLVHKESWQFRMGKLKWRWMTFKRVWTESWRVGARIGVQVQVIWSLWRVKCRGVDCRIFIWIRSRGSWIIRHSDQEKGNLRQRKVPTHSRHSVGPFYRHCQWRCWLSFVEKGGSRRARRATRAARYLKLGVVFKSMSDIVSMPAWSCRSFNWTTNALGSHRPY